MRAAGAEVAVAIGLDAALGQLESWHLLRGSMAKNFAAWRVDHETAVAVVDGGIR